MVVNEINKKVNDALFICESFALIFLTELDIVRKSDLA